MLSAESGTPDPGSRKTDPGSFRSQPIGIQHFDIARLPAAITSRIASTSYTRATPRARR